MEARAATRTNVCNVLVIGSGAAGLRAAIAAHQAGIKALVVGKRQRLDAHTVLAAGGINAALGTRDPQDSWQQHFADTLREGYYLSDPRVVELMAREPALRINFVLKLDTDGRLTVSSQPVPPVPDYLEEWTPNGGVIELKERLLE